MGDIRGYTKQSIRDRQLGKGNGKEYAGHRSRTQTGAALDNVRELIRKVVAYTAMTWH